MSVLIEIADNSDLLLWVLPGFTHGFYATRDNAEALYGVTDYRFAEVERTLLWLGLALNISVSLLSDSRILSDKDRVEKLFSNAELFD